MDVEKQEQRFTLVIIHFNWGVHGIDNKVMTQQVKVIETCYLQVLLRKVEKWCRKVRQKSDAEKSKETVVHS